MILYLLINDFFLLTPYVLKISISTPCINELYIEVVLNPFLKSIPSIELKCDEYPYISLLEFNILSISKALLLFFIKIFDSFYRKIALNFFI